MACQLWTAYQVALADRQLSGPVLSDLHQTLAEAIAGLEPGWDQRFLATTPADNRRARHPAQVRRALPCRGQGQGGRLPRGQARAGPEDLRLRVLAELATTAFSLVGRPWVYADGQGGREALFERHREAVKAIPASLDLTAPAKD
jgi:hypothetical protein